MSKQPNSFLPEEYLRRKADSRSLIINLVLFGAVLSVTIGAFVVSNRQWNDVRTQQAEIDAKWESEKLKLEQLHAMEEQKSALLYRASVTAALLERVPRSILMAELINRMPDNVTITQFDMTSKRIIEQVKPDAAKAEEGKSLVSKLAGPKDDSKAEAVKARPPRLEFSLKIEGTALSDTEVADYQAALKNCPLLDSVDLVSTEEAQMTEVPMRKFRLEARIRTDADAASMQPVRAEKVRNALENVAQRQQEGKASMWSGIFGKARKATITGHGEEPASPGATEPLANAPSNP
ncbi:MAG: PilN domain-containing protein [Phycisphaerales bacterium]|nr:PilN domain-containing protein [Phycisphaerales bacterium]